MCMQKCKEQDFARDLYEDVKKSLYFYVKYEVLNLKNMHCSAVDLHTYI
jgi:hypothetical protein